MLVGVCVFVYLIGLEGDYLQFAEGVSTLRTYKHLSTGVYVCRGVYAHRALFTHPYEHPPFAPHMPSDRNTHLALAHTSHTHT